MDSYDVAVIGAGPAGGQCARRLAAQGRRVLLVERHPTFAANDFSSAGSLVGILDDFALPPAVVGSYWSEIKIQSTAALGVWRSDHPLGVVLDFAALKGFLADETRRTGGDVLMGHEYTGHRALGGADGHELRLTERATGAEQRVVARALVDATGPVRAVMAPSEALRRSYRTAKGLEFLIEVPGDRYLADQLVFFLGYKWTPHGYAWIFPMGRNRLKVGAGQFCLPGYRERSKALKHYIERVIKDWLRLDHYEVLDVHGSTLRVSFGQKDRFHAPGLLAVGDAVSAVNALGGEGIRHGMVSGDVAAVRLGNWLDGGCAGLAGYEREMRAYFGWKWRLSDWLSAYVYGRMSDEHIDRGVRSLARRAGIDDVVDVLFHYRYGKAAVWMARWMLRRGLGLDRRTGARLAARLESLSEVNRE